MMKSEYCISCRKETNMFLNGEPLCSPCLNVRTQEMAEDADEKRWAAERRMRIGVAIRAISIASALLFTHLTCFYCGKTAVHTENIDRRTEELKRLNQTKE